MSHLEGKRCIVTNVKTVNTMTVRNRHTVKRKIKYCQFRRPPAAKISKMRERKKQRLQNTTEKKNSWKARSTPEFIRRQKELA